MKENCPSSTALRVAFRRAAHQILDEPPVFDDPLALRILGLDKETFLEKQPEWLDEEPLSRVLRASLAARSRYAEDSLRNAVTHGVQQYVILGAGMDTFAYRNPFPGDSLKVFEVDHPATQAWKRACLEETGIPIPGTVTFVPVDFETQTLADSLPGSTFDPGKSTFIAWLGVTPYLSDSAITTSFHFVLTLGPGSGIVFDYMISPSLLSPGARKVFDGLAGRVAMLGEPFQSFYDPAALTNTLQTMGFREIEDMTPETLDARYFQGRSDGLRAGRLTHLMHARW